MKSLCKNCAQKEVGCDAHCADRRKQITERKERLKAIKAPHFGTQRETDEALNGIERLMNLGIIQVPVKRKTGGWHYEPIRR